MKNLKTILAMGLLIQAGLYAQTPIVNFDFNSATAYPAYPAFIETGVTANVISSEVFSGSPGIVTSGSAFIQNTTAGKGLFAMAGSGEHFFTFEIAGNALYTYESYEIYLQAARAASGPNQLTLSYSTDGTAYTPFQTYDVLTTGNDVYANLSAITSLNGAQKIYIRLDVTGGTGTAKMGIDNFQVRASLVTLGSGNPGGWQVSSTSMSTLKNVGIGTHSPAYPLDVSGNARVGGSLIAAQGLLFDNANGLRFVPDAQNSFDKYRFGTVTDYLELSVLKLPGGGSVYGFGTVKRPGVYSPCLPPLSNGNVFANRIIVTGSTNALDIFNAGYNAYINLGTDLGYSVPIGTPLRKIQIANLCESDVEICKHPALTSFLSTGPKVEIGNPVRSDLVTLNIKQATYQVDAIKVTNGAGNTNFLVKGTGYVYAREINVLPTNIVFPDYVFAKEYKLMPLHDLENYVNTNKHLPNIPCGAEVERDGINVAEMQVKQMEKIEELYLYVIELKKENELLKKRLDASGK